MLKNPTGGAEMVKMIFMFEVIDAKQNDYLKITRERIKPFWESHGCEAYTLWQVPEEPARFVKEMLFKDEATMQTVMNLDSAQPVKKLFSQFADNITRKTYRWIV